MGNFEKKTIALFEASGKKVKAGSLKAGEKFRFKNEEKAKINVVIEKNSYGVVYEEEENEKVSGSIGKNVGVFKI